MQPLTDSKILVVEDDPRMCESLKSFLGLHGFDVRTRQNLPDARQALQTTAYDLVLLDLTLDDQCGFDLMDHLVDRNLDTQVIVVTGQHSEAAAITALKKGATDYLKKPFDPDDLLESVNKVLNRQQYQRELFLFKSVVRSSSAAIVVGEPTGRVVYANAAYQRLMQPEGSGFTSVSALHGRNGSMDEQIRQALATGKSWEGRADLVNAAGQPFVAWKLVDPIPETVGGKSYAVALLCDMTAQLEHERTVACSRERYRKVIDSQTEYLYRLDRDFAVTFVNKAYANYWGKSPRSMVGQPILSHSQESIQSMLLNCLKAIRSGSPPIESDVLIVDADGCHRWQQWRFEGIRDAEGRVTEIQGVGRDVTRKKMLQKEAEENREKYRNLAEIISDWIWEVDVNGVYTYASPVVDDLLGYQPEEVIGKTIFDFMPDEEARRLEAVLQRCLSAGDPLRNVEKINRRKDGSLVTLETSGVPIFDETGAVVGYRGVDRDISIRKFAEKRLQEESNKLKKALAKVKRLSGMLPICASCKKIRDDSGYWNQIEEYIESNSDAAFSHGICPECARKLYPELYESVKG